METTRVIEASGHIFLWVLPKNMNDVFEEEWLPHGLKERMRENKQGIVVRG